MRNAIIACTLALMSTTTFALPSMADEIFVDGQPSYDRDYDSGRHHHRPGIIISDHGVTVGSVRERGHYQDRDRDRDRCYTKSVTRQTDDGDQVTKTIRRCN